MSNLPWLEELRDTAKAAPAVYFGSITESDEYYSMVSPVTTLALLDLVEKMAKALHMSIARTNGWEELRDEVLELARKGFKK